MRPPLAECDRLLEPLNAGERCVAEKLAELSDEWTVYVQPRLAQDVPDFLAVHDRYGVCAVEVKNWAYGKYRPNDGRRIEALIDGAWTAIDEAPRHQAYRYRSTIFEHHFASTDDAEHPTPVVRSVVLLPHYTTARARELLAHHQVTEQEYSVTVLGGDALRGPAEALVRMPCPIPRPASMNRLRRYLEEADAVRELRTPAKLSAGARNIADNPRQAQRRRVRGPAGCGKSFGLALRAARLAAQGRQVLVLTYNTTLANYLRTLVNSRCKELQANPALVTCVAFHPFCRRIVEDAERSGSALPDAGAMPWHEAVVVQARAACADGRGPKFDAVLIDEGQDFTLDWWTMLRDHVVTEDGEMLLVADPTQDVYGKRAWTDETRMLGAGFSGRWTELRGSYRMPADLVPLANRFASTYLDGERLDGEVPDDHLDLMGLTVPTIRRWINVQRRDEFGAAIGHEVVRLLTTHPDLNPDDVVFLCEHHTDGIAAVKVIEAAGFDVHHIFAIRPEDRPRRKRRFWPDAKGVKGCTVHSFKGWESPIVVVGIDTDPGSVRLAYVAMTRVKIRGDGRPSFLSVINHDLSIAGFQSTFDAWQRPSIPSWAPPLAEARVR